MRFAPRFAGSLRAAPKALFSSAAAPKASRPAVLFVSGVGLALGTGYYTFGADSIIEADEGFSNLSKDLRAELDSATDLLSKHISLPELSKQIVFNALRKDIEAILEDDTAVNPGTDGFLGNSGGGGAIGPMFVRLAWHCSGTYDKDAKNGGSDGATMRFSPEADHGGNAGLHHARTLLEPLYKKYSDLGVTHADLYIFAGNVSIEHMGGPDLPLRPGRSDATGSETPKPNSVHSPDGRLPDADGRGKFPGDHIRDIFYRMNFNDKEIVALSGAHGLGHCHTDRSGFWGPWTNAPTTFSNEYFRLLIEEKWSKKFTHKGAKWTGPEQYEDETGNLMMLPTDVALVHDPRFKVFVEAYANDEDAFFSDFAAAWTKLTENGCNNLAKIEIVNIESKLSDKSEAVQETADKLLLALAASIGKQPKKGWSFW